MKIGHPAVQTTQPKSQPGGRRWMVVDDDEGVRDFIASVLELRGVARVERYGSAHEALTAFNAKPHEFSFVVTDLEMPGMNGIELCRQLRSRSPEVKVVLATGNGVANEAGARRSGFCGLLNKPFPAAELWRMAEAAGVIPSELP